VVPVAPSPVLREYSRHSRGTWRCPRQARVRDRSGARRAPSGELCSVSVCGSAELLDSGPAGRWVVGGGAGRAPRLPAVPRSCPPALQRTL